MIPALKIVVAYLFDFKICSTFLRDCKCLDRLSSLVIPLRYITCLTFVFSSWLLKLIAQDSSRDSKSVEELDIE
jgi:hypothetical protein